jgi:hypothetical protein
MVSSKPGASAAGDKPRSRIALAYSEFREKARDADLLLFSGRAQISRAIRRLTGSPYSHAGFVARWGERLMVIEAVGSGVRAVPTSVAIEAYHGEVEWATLCNGVDIDRKKVVLAAKQYLGLSYSMGGIGRFLLRILFGAYAGAKDKKRQPHAFFCSEFVSRCYREGGLDLAPGEADRFTSPAMIASCPDLEWRGFIHADDRSERSVRAASAG